MKSVLFSSDELVELKTQLGKTTLMGQTLDKHRQKVDAFISLTLEVPGHGEAGGYEHNRHKQNYYHMHLAGNLFQVTGDDKYAQFVIKLLSLYADKYLSFGFHEQKNTNPTGRLFHQILNEHCWLLFSSLAYSCVKSEMTVDEQRHVVDNLFDPMLDMFTNKYSHDFDRIHNHGIWAVAAVGICGLVLDKREYLDMAVYGLEKNETGGFLAQISKLFSPSGYYMEGPYYHRYALHPTCLFAEVIHRFMPEVGIYDYKGGVIGRTVKALLATAYPNGKFPALNDASRTMGVTDSGVQVAVSVLSQHYECDANVIGIAELQGEVWLNSCGMALSQAHEEAVASQSLTTPYWPSIELNEGADGDKGAVGILRLRGKGNDITQLVMSYGQHGMGHGHFDTLGITFFNRGQEVLQEYGFARWVNVEPKFGGRYLPENAGYARQTIAHNIVTVDQQSQNKFNVARADSVHGKSHFFQADNASCLGMSAFADDHYDGLGMQRSVFLLDDEEFEAPLLLDLYRLRCHANAEKSEHVYDYSHQYSGQIVRTNFSYESSSALNCWGDSEGYQHLWKLAEGEAPQSVLISWLQNNTYYSWIGTSSNENAKVVFTKGGANDPSFNLRPNTGFTLRSQGADTLFASVLETHGYFNEEFEQSTQARGVVESVRVVGHNETGSVVQVCTHTKHFTLMVSNLPDCDTTTEHCVEFEGVTYRWNGYYLLSDDLALGEKK